MPLLATSLCGYLEIITEPSLRYLAELSPTLTPPDQTPVGLLWQVSVGSPHSNKEREGKAGQVTLCMLGSVSSSTERQDRAAGRSRRLGWNLRALSFWGIHLISKPQFLHLKMKVVKIPTPQGSCRTAWDGPHGAFHTVSKTRYPVSSSSSHLCPQKGGYKGTYNR